MIIAIVAAAVIGVAFAPRAYRCLARAQAKSLAARARAVETEERARRRAQWIARTGGWATTRTEKCAPYLDGFGYGGYTEVVLSHRTVGAATDIETMNDLGLAHVSVLRVWEDDDRDETEQLSQQLKASMVPSIETPNWWLRSEGIVYSRDAVEVLVDDTPPPHSGWQRIDTHYADAKPIWVRPVPARQAALQHH